MTRLYLSIIILAIFTLNAYSQATVPENRLFFPQMVDNGGPQRGYLPLVNTGQDAISVTSIRANCSCTQARIDKDIIAPADTALVEIIFNPTGMVGEVHKKVTLTLAPNDQRLELTVGANVIMSEATLLRKYPVAIELNPNNSDNHDSAGSSKSKSKSNSKSSVTVKTAEEQEQEPIEGQFLLNRLDASIKAAPNQMIPILTYNHTNKPLAMVITEQPKYVKAQPLLPTIEPETACTLLIETKADIPAKTSMEKIKCKIISTETGSALGVFVIELMLSCD